jgi:hypothetical protein
MTMTNNGDGNGSPTDQQSKTIVQQMIAEMDPQSLIGSMMLMMKTKALEAAEPIPAETRQGFVDGRKVGNDLINNVPYAVGAAAGFPVGVVGGVHEAVCNWVHWLWHGDVPDVWQIDLTRFYYS